MSEILLISALVLIIAILAYIGKSIGDLYTKVWHIEYFTREADKIRTNINAGELKIESQLNPYANQTAGLKITIRKESEYKYSGEAVTTDGKFKTQIKASGIEDLENKINGFIKAVLND